MSYGTKDFKWDKHRDLMFQERAVASLVRHEIHPKHWCIKFEWRDEKTPEFFNLTNAKENAVRICTYRMNLEGASEALGSPYSGLNDLGGPIQRGKGKR